MITYSIKDLEKFSGIKAHTIRIWEKRFQIFTPNRTDTNIRQYSEEDLKYLLNLTVLYNKGIKISEIVTLSTEVLKERVMDIAIHAEGPDGHVESLVIAMIELNEVLFDKTITTSMIRIGFEDTILHLIYPFFEKVGLLWQTGSIMPAQEHFISCLIRQKLIVAIDSITAPRALNSKNYLLFLPEGEWHELGLLFMFYAIKKRGNRVTYLGPNVPGENLKSIIKTLKPCCVVTQYITSQPLEDVKSQLLKLQKLCIDSHLFISGGLLKRHPEVMPNSLKKYRDIYDFIAWAQEH